MCLVHYILGAPLHTLMTADVPAEQYGKQPIQNQYLANAGHLIEILLTTSMSGYVGSDSHIIRDSLHI